MVLPTASPNVLPMALLVDPRTAALVTSPTIMSLAGYSKEDDRSYTGPIGVNNTGNQQDTSNSLLHAPVPKHQEDEHQEAKHDEPKHDQPKLVATEVIFYNQFESQVQNSKTIKPKSGAYTLEPDLSNDLWDGEKVNLAVYLKRELWIEIDQKREHMT
ncbi:hypothetical protein PG985_009464 [Apiospora marii]|uniref:uncharacterized protein n=1 Tax=Apiospora marii TaxID=335849 RepID=UPI00312CD1E2